MEIKLNLNGKDICQDISPDMLLIDFLRMNGCLSVKRGCDTSNCGLCTVFMDDKPILSCSILALRVAGHKIVTLEVYKKKLVSLLCLLQIKELNNAVFVIQDL